jgi:hypothetical protein
MYITFNCTVLHHENTKRYDCMVTALLYHYCTPSSTLAVDSTRIIICSTMCWSLLDIGKLFYLIPDATTDD